MPWQLFCQSDCLLHLPLYQGRKSNRTKHLLVQDRRTVRVQWPMCIATAWQREIELAAAISPNAGCETAVVPAGFDGQCSGRVHSLTRSRSDQLGCGRPLWHSVPAPGPLFLLFAQVVRQVCWALSMHASALRTSCACSLCTLQAPRWLVSDYIIGSAEALPIL